MHFSKRHVTGISQCTQEQYVEKLKTNSYGKCVYNTDNNVCDHQTVSMLFEGNITVTMAVSAFSKDCYRNIHIHGTKGEIVGKDSDEVLILNVFGGKRKKIKTKARGAGHLGGDYGICRTFHQLMKNEPIDKNYLTTIDVTLLSHKIVFGAEESRKNGGQLIKL